MIADLIQMALVVAVVLVATATAQECPLFKCPTPTANCFAPPCQVSKCEAFPNLKCCPACNCNAVFLHANGTIAQCGGSSGGTSVPTRTPPACPVFRCPTPQCADAPCSANNRACPLRPNIENEGGQCCRGCGCEPLWLDRAGNAVTCQKPEPEPPSNGCPTNLVCPAIACSSDRPTCANTKCAAYANATCCSGCCGAPSFRVDGERVECDVCQLPSVSGPCEAAFPRFFFDKASGACKSFLYGGCGGNANNFHTEADCQSACVPRTTRICQTCPSDTQLKAQCDRQFGVNGYSIVKSRDACCSECVANLTKPSETTANDQCATVRCKSPTVVESECRDQFGEGQFTLTRGPCCATCEPKNPCKLPILTGSGKAAFPSFGFDATKNACVRFIFGGGETNANRFDSLEACTSKCGGTNGATTSETKTSALVDETSSASASVAGVAAAVAAVVAAQL